MRSVIWGPGVARARARARPPLRHIGLAARARAYRRKEIFVDRRVAQVRAFRVSELRRNLILKACELKESRNNEVFSGFMGGTVI